MKKIKLYVLGVLLMGAQAVMGQGGIEFFHGPFAQAQNEAEATGKLIFMDAYAEWCGPCKYMARHSFTDGQVGELFNKSFVNLKMDMEKGEGPRLARIYRVRAYPTLYILNAEGEILEKVVGGIGPEPLYEWAYEAIEKHAPHMLKESTPEPVEEAPQGNIFDGGHEEDVFADPFGGDKKETVASGGKTSGKSTSGSGKVTSGSKSTGITTSNGAEMDRNKSEHLVDHVAAGEALEDNSMKHYLPMYNHHPLEDLEAELIKAVESKDRKRMMDLSHQLLESDEVEKKMLFVEAWRAWAVATDNVTDMVINVSEMMALEKNPSALLLNNAAWYFFEMTDDEDALVLAASWAQKSIDKEPAYYNYDTFAQLMFIAGEMDLAKKYGNKSVEMAKAEGMDASGTLEMLAQIPN